MAERNPVFELHIRPLFRLLDRQHMLRVTDGMDLWDYDVVKTTSALILQISKQSIDGVRGVVVDP